MSIYHINKFRILTIFICLVSSAPSLMAAQTCENRVFNIKITSSVSTNDVLNQLSDMCNFSIIEDDSHTKTTLDANINGINIKNLSLSQIFNVLISQKNLNYEYNNNMLKISTLETKTFKLDYITSVREGIATVKASVDSAPVEADNQDNGDQGGGDENQNTNLIKTTEKFDFWQNLSQELTAILNNGKENIVVPMPVINPNAGLITVTGTKAQIKRVENYIDDIKKSLKKQVMIEVSIISVELNNQFTKGVDWSKFELGFNSYQNKGTPLQTPSTILFNTGSVKAEGGTGGEGGGTTMNVLTPAQSLRNITGGFVLGGGVQLSMDGVLNFLETNGKTRVVSNPKIMTMNNQQALITVGDNINYRVQEQSTNDASTTQRTDTTFKQYTIFIGILLNLLPEISDDGKIMLRINPSLSNFKYSQDNQRQDKPREVAPDTLQKKLSTVVNVNSGDTIILGGLIGETKGNDNTKVPILGDIPVLGNLFKSTTDSVATNELIFIITPKIIDVENTQPIKDSLKDLGFSESLYE